jgi:hypothetical protein
MIFDSKTRKNNFCISDSHLVQRVPCLAQDWSTALTVDFSLTSDFSTTYAPGTHFE